MTARTSIPVHTVDRFDGLDLATATATAGDASNNMSLVNDGRTCVIMHNTNAGSTARTCGIVTNVSVEGLAASVVTKTLAAGESREYGPFPPETYGGVMKLNPSHAELTFIAKRYPGS